MTRTREMESTYAFVEDNKHFSGKPESASKLHLKVENTMLIVQLSTLIHTSQSDALLNESFGLKVGDLYCPVVPVITSASYPRTQQFIFVVSRL